jgi:hypothetical protein
MNEIVESKLKNDGHRLDGASLEKTVTYETGDGAVTEKTTLNYKHDSGNVIDNAINQVRSSEHVKNTGDSAKSAFFTLVKFSLIIGGIGFVLFILAIMGGLIS